MRKILLSLMLLLLFTSCFKESNENEVTDALKNTVDSYYAAAKNKSGISVAIHGDGYSWTYATGLASNNIAMTTATPTFAYSITKTFVSALVLKQIEEEKKYSLTSTVDSLLTGNVDYDSLTSEQKARLNINATVEDLLNHTSGMPDYASNVEGIKAMSTTAAYDWKPVEILKSVVNKSYSNTNWLNDVFEYSNTNYILLGMIAEHEGGKTLNVLLKENFFDLIDIDSLLGPLDPVPSNIAHPFDDAYLFGNGVFPPIGFFYDLILGLAMNPETSTLNFYLGAGRST